MKQYKTVLGNNGAGPEPITGPVIVLTIEELQDVFKSARLKQERGDSPYIYPHLSHYLQSKGITLP